MKTWTCSPSSLTILSSVHIGTGLPWLWIGPLGTFHTHWCEGLVLFMNESFHYSSFGIYWYFILFIAGGNHSFPYFWAFDKYCDVSLRFPSHTSASVSRPLLHGLLCSHLSQTLVALLQPLPLASTQGPSWHGTCTWELFPDCNSWHLPEEVSRSRLLLVT